MRGYVRAHLVDIPSVRYVRAAATIPIASVAEGPDPDIDDPDGEYDVVIALLSEK